ncbi:MAG: hypothetical protein RLZZ272_1678, partial [Actinomycetota bacterium]
MCSLVVLLGGCASGGDGAVEVPAGTEEEAPTPFGPSVAVVLPEQGVFGGPQLAEVRASLAELLAREAARERPSGGSPPLASFRVIVAADAAELRDQVAVLAEAGTDLICVLGGVGDEALRDAARLHARPTYCELPPVPPEARAVGTGNAPARLTVDVPVEGLGRALGGLARAAASEPSGPASDLGASGAAPEVTLGAPPSVVAVVVGSDPAIGAALRRGVLAADEQVGAGAPTEVLVRASEPDRDPAEVVAELLKASVDVLVVDGAPGADALVASALDAGLAVLAPEALVAELSEARSAGVVASWRMRWDLALELVVAHVRDRPGPAALAIPLEDFVE